MSEFPELQPFVLSNVHPTGVTIGFGSYGRVEEVRVSGAICAAKKVHDIFQLTEFHNISNHFVRECRLMSILRHPNIVQFLGIASVPDSQLPVLIMEKLQTNLHDFLVNAPDPDSTRPFFPPSLKCSILHNVASGLAYLHEQTPPIIHRDLSAKNILLTSDKVAKITDLGTARLFPYVRATATMTTMPGAIAYMPPEAMENRLPEENEVQPVKAKYGTSIDVFSFGVVTIFTLSESFPYELLAPNYREFESSQLKARTEFERREKYMKIICKALSDEHPLIMMIKDCLDFPEKRPSIQSVLHLLDELKSRGIKDKQIHMNQLQSKVIAW